MKETKKKNCHDAKILFLIFCWHKKLIMSSEQLTF